MILEKFGNRVKELRAATGLSQEKFAYKIDMDRTYYSAIESGRHNVSLKNIEKIAIGLGTNLTDLFKGI